MMWPITERRTPRPPLSRRLAVILALLTMGFTTFVFFQADRALEKIDAEVTERRDKDHLVNKLICERQDNGLNLSVESRRFIRTTDNILRELVLISVNPEAIREAQRERGPLNRRELAVITAFREKANLLKTQIKQIRKGEKSLKRNIAGLDCDDLPPDQVPEELKN